MSSAKLAVASCLAAVAVAGCGAVHIKPAASSGATQLTSRGVIDDPRTHVPDRVACLRADGFRVTETGRTGLQIGSPSSGPSVTFAPTPGAAQADQIEGVIQGAEVIGSALLYPHHASDSALKKVENCLAKSVTG
jgi:hypothetical protein